MRYFVALDLGSDSMVAALSDGQARGEHPRLLPLQERAMAYVHRGARDPDAGAALDPILERDGMRVSERLRTRISLVDERQPPQILDSHAALDAVDDAASPSPQSLFRFFHSQGGQNVLESKLLPNPKIPFQLGARHVFPRVKAKSAPGSGGQTLVNLSPDTLLKHLTAQVLRSFVLRSSPLQNVDARREVHLLITVPNVYSLTHKQALCDFVASQNLVARVEAIYESDALAYGLWTEFEDITPELVAFRKNMRSAFVRGRQRLLTVDVGRGTTDLSLIEWQDSQNPGEPRRHLTLARTGRSEGGNTVSHIFARYYQGQLQRVLKGLNLPLPFDLLYLFQVDGSEDLVKSTEHATAIKHIEALIEEVKRSINAQMECTLPARNQKKHLERFAEAVATSGAITQRGTDKVALKLAIVQGLLLPNPQTATTTASPTPTTPTPTTVPAPQSVVPSAPLLPNNTAYDERLAQLQKVALDVLSKVGAATKDALGGLFNIATTAATTSKDRALIASPGQNAIGELDELQRELRSHIERSCVALVGEIFSMAADREQREGDSPGARSDCWVLVAGQASQFAPLRARIESTLKRAGTAPNRVHFLEGPLSKTICCLGAIEYERSGALITGQEIFGTYGILTPVTSTAEGEEEFLVLNNEQLMSDAGCVETFHSPSRRQLVFIPGAPPPQGYVPEVRDGRTAILAQTRGGNSVSVRYDRQKSKLLFNDEEVVLAGFGDTQANIWSQVWPDTLSTRPADAALEDDDDDVPALTPPTMPSAPTASFAPAIAPGASSGWNLNKPEPPKSS